jgi:TolB-like protein
MKTMITVLMAVFFTAMAYAQGAADVITKTNGEVAKGKVSEITETAVKFTYDGETLLYTINKSDIRKITYASGRTEIFNDSQPAAPVNHKNKIAILPFSYLIDKQDAGEAMTYQVQQETFTFLKKNAPGYEVQDPTTSNALLTKSGVDNNTLRGFTMSELCNILGVEYIITGSIRQDLVRTNNYQSANASYDNKSKENTSGTNRTNSGGSYSNSSGTTTQSYQTNITMNVFKDDGSNLFNQSHNSFWATTNAYVTTLRFLLKKTPFYQ